MTAGEGCRGDARKKLRPELDEVEELRAALAAARAELADRERRLAAVEALCGDNAWFADFGEPPNEDVVPGVRESDVLAALGDPDTTLAEVKAQAWDEGYVHARQEVMCDTPDDECQRNPYRDGGRDE